MNWTDPEEPGLGHYGPHVPVSVDGEKVVCANCGAEALDADPEVYP